MGDAFKVGSWNLGGHYKWMAPIALIEIDITCIVAMFPTSAGGMPWDSSFQWKYVNYTPVLVGSALIVLWIAWHLFVKRWFTGPRTTVGLPDGVSSADEIRLEHCPNVGTGGGPAARGMLPSGCSASAEFAQTVDREGDHTMADHPRNPRLLSVDALRAGIDDGEIDTVVVAFTDMQGRLQGKRLHAPYFLDEVLDHGTEGCNYLLAVDVEMNTVPGYAISSWEKGYGDMMFVLDLDTIRRLTHLPGTVLVQCDLAWLDGEPVEQSPRRILRRQVERAAEAGYQAFAGTELEFIVFEDTYEQAWDAGYTGLTPANQYNVDYSILGTTRLEPLLRDIRNVMYDAGLTVESAKGECNFGQHEVAFRFAEVLTTADNHSVYKNSAKEIADLHARSLTFMAKYDEREGNSCHIHLSLRGLDGELVFADGHERSARLRPVRGRSTGHHVRVHPAVRTEHQLLQAVRRRLVRPDDDRLGHGQPHVRRAPGRAWRRHADENRVPGGDVNPYLAIAGMLAGGLYGIAEGLELEPELIGNAYESGRPTVPRTLREARDAFAGSSVARAALGDAVVDHYVHAADTELAAFGAAVTDWERRRGFERL